MRRYFGISHLISAGFTRIGHEGHTKECNKCDLLETKLCGLVPCSIGYYKIDRSKTFEEHVTQLNIITIHE